MREYPFKLSVFVGSPKRDLELVRQAIILAILEAGHVPDGMELWASDARPTLKTISDKLRFCDLHVVVLGPNYGEILRNEGISFTEWEYIQSRDANRPIISFLLEEQAFKAAWEQSPPKEEEKKLYLKLWDELRRKSVCKLYPSIQMSGIDKDVMNSVNQVIDAGELLPLSGWIRRESKAAQLTEALQRNSFLMRIMDRVVKFQTTGRRMEEEHRAKKAAADLFWDTMMNRLVRAGYNGIFLESGSSLAYVSESFEYKLYRQQGWQIATNNSLSLLHLLLFTDGYIRRNPPVAPDPDDPYGAIFTRKCMEAYEDPHVKPRPLFQKEIEAIEEIIGLLKSDVHNQIILATASGWDTQHQVSAFHGPHIGSHANMLFKRAIFMTGHPVVVFLSRHKVDPAYREAHFKCRTDREKPAIGVRYCYPVFGEELPLQVALKDTPLALCIGYELEKGDEVEDVRQIGEKLKSVLAVHLDQMPFDLDYAAKEFRLDDGRLAGAFMVANERFARIFPKQ